MIFDLLLRMIDDGFIAHRSTCEKAPGAQQLSNDPFLFRGGDGRIQLEPHWGEPDLASYRPATCTCGRDEQLDSLIRTINEDDRAQVRAAVELMAILGPLVPPPSATAGTSFFRWTEVIATARAVAQRMYELQRGPVLTDADIDILITGLDALKATLLRGGKFDG